MSMFLLGYMAAVLTYLVIGFILGTAIVFTNMDRFHGAGFQVKRMIKHILLVSFFWPGMFVGA